MKSIWKQKIDSEKFSPWQLWRSIHALMGRGSASESDTIGVQQFHNHFDCKVDGVRSATDGEPTPSLHSTVFLCSPNDVHSVLMKWRLQSEHHQTSAASSIYCSIITRNNHWQPFLAKLSYRSLLTPAGCGALLPVWDTQELLAYSPSRNKCTLITYISLTVQINATMSKHLKASGAQQRKRKARWVEEDEKQSKIFACYFKVEDTAATADSMIESSHDRDTHEKNATE